MSITNTSVTFSFHTIKDKPSVCSVKHIAYYTTAGLQYCLEAKGGWVLMDFKKEKV